MNIVWLIGVSCFLHVLLGIIIACIISDSRLASHGFEFVNPAWLHKRIRVNWFGAVLLAIIFNILVLPDAVLYWIYKLCTVGR